MRHLSGISSTLLLAAAMLVGGCAGEPVATTDQGDPAKSERATYLDAMGVAGQVALIQFGRIGCPVSDEGMDRLIDLARGGSIAELAFARVEADTPVEKVQQYQREKNPPFKVIRDGDRSIAKFFDATIEPTYLLVDKFGNVRYRGSYPSELLDEWVGVLLAERTDPAPNVTLFGQVELDGPKLLAGTVLPALEDRARPLSDYVAGGGVLLVFVNTTCPYSDQAVDEVPEVAENLRRIDIPTVIVNLDEDAQTVTDYFAAKSPGVPVVYDTTLATTMKWNIQSVPTLVCLDGDGKILYNGKALWADLGDAINAQPKPEPVQFHQTGTGFG